MVPNTFSRQKVYRYSPLPVKESLLLVIYLLPMNESPIKHELIMSYIYSTLWESFENTRDDTDVNLTIAYFKVDQGNEKTMEVLDFN